MKSIMQKAESVAKECKEYLLAHLDDLELYNVDTHYVQYTLEVEKESYLIQIWTANGEDCAKFYDSIPMLKLDYIEYTDEEKAKLWAKAQADKTQSGEKRNIKMDRLSNDLFFSFQGVYGQVKFSGYNDNDWWTKYKPSEIKETEDIVWKIDLEKNIATYKPKQK